MRWELPQLGCVFRFAMNEVPSPEIKAFGTACPSLVIGALRAPEDMTAIPPLS